MSKFKQFMAKIDERQAILPQQQVPSYQDPQAEAKSLNNGIKKLSKLFDKLSGSQEQWAQMGIQSNGIQMQMPKDLLKKQLLDTEITALKNAKSGILGVPLIEKGDGSFVINKRSIDEIHGNMPDLIKQSKLSPWDKTKNIARKAYGGALQTNVRSDAAQTGFSGVGAGR